jgi:hypothetical protein
MNFKSLLKTGLWGFLGFAISILVLFAIIYVHIFLIKLPLKSIVIAIMGASIFSVSILIYKGYGKKYYAHLLIGFALGIIFNLLQTYIHLI